MSILIKGMEMPHQRPICIVIDAAGQVRQYDLANDRYMSGELYEATSLPPHGRLIDADALMTRFEDAELSSEMHGREFTFSFLNNAQVLSTEWYFVDQLLDDAPTIIEAEEGET